MTDTPERAERERWARKLWAHVEFPLLTPDPEFAWAAQSHLLCENYRRAADAVLAEIARVHDELEDTRRFEMECRDKIRRMAAERDALTAERDEARAKLAEAADELACVIAERDVLRLSIAQAEQRGAERMREACAQRVASIADPPGDPGIGAGLELAVRAIRALPAGTHGFVGRLDRVCEQCGRSDRDPIHHALPAGRAE